MNVKEAKIKVSEIFGPTIQGEGVLIGIPTVFVRSGGWDWRCLWCDSLHALDPEYRANWPTMTTSAAWNRITELSYSQTVTISPSGGNPAIQPFGPLIARGKATGYRFALETQGSVCKDWFLAIDSLALSQKSPSSGKDTDWTAFDQCLAATDPAQQVALKIVIFDIADYCYAKAIATKYLTLPVYLQPGNHTLPHADDDALNIDSTGLMDQMHWLVDLVTTDRWFDARVLPQLHVLLWGNKRGV